MKKIVRPAAWAFYLIIVFEILFMISPFALHFYALYGPTLNFLHRLPATAWLTRFYLPHFSQTSNALFNILHELAWVPILGGGLLFLAGAIPIYWSKFTRRGAVTGGLYAVIRHPQYVGLMVAGLGTVLLWPRFIVLFTYVTMLFLYTLLARWEEELCLAKFGESYRAHMARTGGFLPQSLSRRIPRLLPASGHKRVLAATGAYMVLIAATGLIGFGLLDYSLTTISASYFSDAAVISPAALTDEELSAVYDTAMSNGEVQETVSAAAPVKLIVYVVPEEWYLPDLPLDQVRRPGGHYVPENFDRSQYKVLFTAARIRSPEVTGRNIVKAAFGRDPIVLAKVDISMPAVTGIETPPPHVFWGDIPTPMF
jgi:protein-S-isoprenylcysteine O-methyltransferase Ste14